MKPEESVRRLRVLIDKLMSVDENLIRMREWFADECDKLNCQTAACAGGWACRIEEFAELGLVPHNAVVRFGDDYSYAALRKFFGIDVVQVLWIFDPWKYRNDTVERSTVSNTST